RHPERSPHPQRDGDGNGVRRFDRIRRLGRCAEQAAADHHLHHLRTALNMYIGALPPASNRGAYTLDFELYDDETDEGIDLAGASIVLELRRPGTSSIVLSATSGNGRVVLAGQAGRFELSLPATDLRSLDPMTYEAGITIAQGGTTTQYF